MLGFGYELLTFWSDFEDWDDDPELWLLELEELELLELEEELFELLLELEELELFELEEELFEPLELEELELLELDSLEDLFLFADSCERRVDLAKEAEGSTSVVWGGPEGSSILTSFGWLSIVDLSDN